MRIISGTYKGRTIPAPISKSVRPTTDYAKSALFNILENKLNFEELAVLDLFCGTGSISFEFLSRGVKQITAVDIDARSVKWATNFAKTLGFEKKFKAYKNDCIRATCQVKEQFELVFCDPPYNYPKHAKLISAIIEHKLVKQGGWLIIEHGSKTKLEGEPFFTEVRKYGNVFFSFFEINYE